MTKGETTSRETDTKLGSWEALSSPSHSDRRQKIVNVNLGSICTSPHIYSLHFSVCAYVCVHAGIHTCMWMGNQYFIHYGNSKVFNSPAVKLPENVEGFISSISSRSFHTLHIRNELQFYTSAGAEFPF